MKTLLIIGASGLMGQRVLALAKKWMPEVRIITGSRSGGRQEPTDLKVDILDETSVTEALVGVDGVINVVGPYDYSPTVLIKGCFAAECHYVDLAEVPEFIQSVYEQVYKEKKDASKTVTVISGCSTIPGMIDTMSASWQEDESVVRLRSFLSMGSKNPTSATLIYSLLLPFCDIKRNNFEYLTTKILRFGQKRLYGNHASPYDASGMSWRGGSIPAEFWISFDRRLYSYLLKLSSYVLPVFPLPWVKLICRMAQFFSPLINQLGTTQGSLIIEALDKEGQVIHQISIYAEENGLNIPALPSVLAIKKSFEAQDSQSCENLSQLLTPEAFKVALTAEGYQVEME